jgi:hypothetical protein
MAQSEFTLDHKCEDMLKKQAVLIGLARGNRCTYLSPTKSQVTDVIAGEHTHKDTTVKQLTGTHSMGRNRRRRAGGGGNRQLHSLPWSNYNQQSHQNKISVAYEAIIRRILMQKITNFFRLKHQSTSRVAAWMEDKWNFSYFYIFADY